MRKLKLQMMTTLDGFVAGPEGQLDWFQQGDEAFLETINDITDSSDTILMGRKMTPEFIAYWENIVDHHPESPEFSFAQKMVRIPKITFSKTVQQLDGKNLTVENRDLATVIAELKKAPGRDIVAYGGAAFASALIDLDLVDEYYFFTNAVVLGKGMSIFSQRNAFELVSVTPYGKGIVGLKLTRK
jgi:dihydrofolate reductase